MVEGVLVKLDDSRDYLTYRLGPAGTVELLDIAVYGERRQGRGRALLDKMLAQLPEDARTVYAFCRSRNEKAAGFYPRVGFVETALLPRFYIDDRPGCDYESATVYVREINR